MIIKAAKLLISFILIIFPYMSFSQTLYGVWTDLDGSSVNPGISGENQVDRRYPRMAIDQKDQPHIIWQHGADQSDGWRGEIYYRFWNKELGKWDTYGDADKEGGFTQSNNHASGSESAIAIDSKGYPHVIYGGSDESIYYHYLYYRFWDGEKWTSYGGADQITEPSVLSPIEISLEMQVAFYLDKNDYPWIASTTKTGITFVFWDGEKWSGYGDSYSQNGLDTSPYSSIYGGPIVKEVIDNNGNPLILSVSKRDKDGKSALPTIIEWSGSKWLFTDLGELNFSVGHLKIDLNGRIHALGTSSDLASKPICYKYYEDNVWKTLGPNGFEIPFTLDANTSGFNTCELYEMDFELVNNDYPHIVYSSIYNSYSRLRYVFWDGEHWNGREFSQLKDGLHDSSGNFKLYCKDNPLMQIDSKGQPCITYEKLMDLTNSHISYLYCDLSYKNSDLAIGIISNKTEYIFEEKDNIDIAITCVNPNKKIEVNLFLVLQNIKTEECWFFPNWTYEIKSLSVFLPEDLSIPLTHILSFDIPCDNPPLTYNIDENRQNSFNFIFAAFNKDNTELLDMKKTCFLIYPPGYSPF